MIDSTKKYKRLFKVGGLRYLISDIWMDHYKKLETLVTVIDDEFTSYLPASKIDETLEYGKNLHTRSDFENYHKDFTVYMDSALNFFNDFKQKVIIEKEDLITFMDYATGFFPYYSKTEFFYTDLAYTVAQQKNDEKIHENLKRLGELKNTAREKLNTIFFGTNSYLSDFLDKISEKFTLNRNDLEYYSKEEIYQLFDGLKVSSKNISMRKKAFIMKGDSSNKLETIVGEDAIKIIGSFSESQNKNMEVLKVIKGIIANKGKAEGSAKIIRADYDNFDALGEKVEEMNPGDILFAETTSPELIQACKKASAIVTDQGGLLSHAAIISRELNIPCIVGTNDATKVFKDGDKVEVDADNGIVKKIN